MDPIALLTQYLSRGSKGAYVCKGCGTTYDLQYHVCPRCEGFSIESHRQTWMESDTETVQRPG